MLSSIKTLFTKKDETTSTQLGYMNHVFSYKRIILKNKRKWHRGKKNDEKNDVILKVY